MREKRGEKVNEVIKANEINKKNLNNVSEKDYNVQENNSFLCKMKLSKM